MSEDQLNQFMAITNTGPDIAAKCLEICQNDLERAISFFFENGASLLASSSADADAELSSRLQNEEYAENDVREPMARVTETLVGGYDDFDPQEFMNRGGVYANAPGFEVGAGSVFGGGVGERGIFNQVEPELMEYEEDSDAGDAEELYDRQFTTHSGLTDHQKRLAQLYRPPFDIISKLGLEAAKQQGRKEKKWILINIQDMSNFQCQILNRDFWSDRDIKDIVQNNFVFLQYRKEQYDAVKYKQFNEFDEYPHIAILDPFSGARFKYWSSVPDKKEWIREIYKFYDKNPLTKDKKNPIVTSKQDIDISALSEEQQLEYAKKQSVAQYGSEIDFENDDEEESEVEFEDDDAEVVEVDTNIGKTDDNPVVVFDDEEGEEEEQEEEEEEEEDESLLDDDMKFAKIIGKEHLEPEKGTPDVTRIKFRFASGKSYVRAFSVKSLVIEIYEFLKFSEEEVKGKVFVLRSQRVNLIDKLKETIEDAKLKNSSIMVEIE